MSFFRYFEAGAGGASLALTKFGELFNPQKPKEVEFVAFLIFAFCLIHGIISSDHGISKITETFNIGGDDYDGPNSD